MILDLSSLKKAIISLEKAIKFSEKVEKSSGFSKDEKDIIKAGVIQNFEFTYELAWKFMKRWIQENISREVVDGVTKKELYRVAAENRLIDEVKKWFKFHKARNRTSHIYDENVAEDVYKTVKLFLPEVKLFFERIEVRND